MTDQQLAFDGHCGLAAAVGRRESADSKVTRVIDGRTVAFQGRAARLTSHLLTGKIRKALADGSA